LHRLERQNLIEDAEVARGRGIPAFAGMTRNEAGMTGKKARSDREKTRNDRKKTRNDGEKPGMTEKSAETVFIQRECTHHPEPTPRQP